MIRVVVIDDEELVAEACATALRFSGFEVAVAGDGASGLRLIYEQLPDVVVSDIVMPGLDGLELTARLKAQPATAHIPVILVSGNIQPDENTCDAFLPKPFVVRDLVAAIQRLAARQKKS